MVLETTTDHHKNAILSHFGTVSSSIQSEAYTWDCLQQGSVNGND